MQKVNLNETVKVKLTEHGKRIGGIKPEDVEGYSEWQLWILIQVFGPHMHLTSKPFFEDNMIYFPD